MIPIPLNVILMTSNNLCSHPMTSNHEMRCRMYSWNPRFLKEFFYVKLIMTSKIGWRTRNRKQDNLFLFLKYQQFSPDERWRWRFEEAYLQISSRIKLPSLPDLFPQLSVARYLGSLSNVTLRISDKWKKFLINSMKRFKHRMCKKYTSEHSNTLSFSI